MVDFRINIDGLWTSLDTYGEAPAITFQVNSLAEFKDRNNDYSQTVKLPKSPANMRALGLYLGIPSSSSAPYNEYKCMVTDGGTRVTPLGAVFYVTALTRYDIEGQILGTTASVIDDLGELDCNTLEEDGFWVKCDINSIFEGIGKLANGVRMIWPLIEPAADWSNSGFQASNWFDFINSPARVYPHLNLIDVAIWILEHEGYNVKADSLVLDDTAMLCPNYYMGCVNPVIVEGGVDYSTWQNASCEFERWEITSYNVYSGSNQFSAASGEIYSQTPEGTVTAQKDYFEMTAQYTGKYEIKFVGNYAILDTWGLAWQFEYELYDTDGDFVQSQKFSSEDLHAEVAISVGMVLGQTIRVKAYCVWTVPSSNPFPTVFNVLAVTVNFALESVEETSDEQGEEPQIGTTYDLLASLGFSNRKEIIQEFMTFFGLSMRIDPITNTIEFFNFADMLGKVPEEAVDWSGRLAPKEEGTVEYRLDGYAQRNYFVLKADEDFQVKVPWTINDKYLDREKDIFESKFLSVRRWRMYELLGQVIESSALEPVYPLYEFDDEGSASFKSLGSPVIIAFETDYYSTLDFTLYQGTTSKTVALMRVYPILLSQLVTSNGAKWTAPYYVLWQLLRNGCKTLEAYFNFRPQDIEELDLTKPVWLEQFGHWFYVQKINNYRKGELTKVNLLMLK